MSHFLTAVIVPATPDEGDILKSVAELLASYDENGECFREGSHWDWWTIGGRWDGELVGEAPDEWDMLVPPSVPSLERNMSLVSFRHPDFRPWAVVTPDGEWHERAQMGWFGMARSEHDDDWSARCEDIFARYPDHLVVAVDCHV